MALIDALDKQLASTETLYPFRELTDEQWQYTIENGERVPIIDYSWRDVGFIVDRPNVTQVNYVAKHSITYQAVKGLDTPITRFNPEFMKDVTGYTRSQRLIKDWVGVEMIDKDGNRVPKPYDPEWLYKKMRSYGGMFIYTRFMTKYNELMDAVREEEKLKDEKDENFS